MKKSQEKLITEYEYQKCRKNVIYIQDLERV